MPSQFQIQPGFSSIEKVRVVGTPSGDTISVRKLSDTNSANIISARLLKHIPSPAAQTIGVIIYVTSGSERVCYWFGEEGSVIQQSQDETEHGTSQDEIFFSNDDNTATLKVSQNVIQISNPALQINSDAQAFSLTHGNLQARLNSTLIEMRNANNTFRLGTNSQIITNSDLNIQASGGLKLTTAGSLTISSGVNNPSDSNPFTRLGPITTFMLKSADARIAVGGVANMDAGAFTLNVTSRRLIDPLSNVAFKLNVVQGDATVTVGMGNFDLNTLGITNFASMTAGSLSTGMYSKIKVTRLYGEFKNFLSGMNAMVSVRRGEVSIEATRKINLESDATFSISSNANGSIESKAQLNLKATGQMKLESSAIIDVKAAMLKFQDSKMISLGSPRTVAPNPSMTGGWCAIAICPFAQIPHAGDILI